MEENLKVKNYYELIMEKYQYKESLKYKNCELKLLLTYNANEKETCGTTFRSAIQLEQTLVQY